MKMYVIIVNVSNIIKDNGCEIELTRNSEV